MKNILFIVGFICLQTANAAYVGNSGARYQYDLNDPSDSLNYSVDVDANMRDSLYRNSPNVQMDRQFNQNGGGYYDD